MQVLSKASGVYARSAGRHFSEAKRWKIRAIRLKASGGYILGTVFAIGLVLAGSDGNWFPWLNLFGAGLIAAVGLISNFVKGDAEYF